MWHLPAGARAEVGLTFDQVREDANRVAACLRGHGVVPGDAVLIAVPMSAPLYAIMLGVAQAGATSVFIDPAAGRSHLEAACQMANPRVFFGVDRAHWLRWLSPAVRRIPLTFRVKLAGPVARWLGPWAPDPEVSAVAPDAAAVIVYTTGSTGTPKPVRRSHHHIVAQLAALDQHAAKGPNEVDLPMWPILLFDGLCHGRTSVIPVYTPGRIAQADPAALLAQMRRCGVSIVVGPPVLYERLCAHVERRGEKLPFRHAFVGGSVVTPALLERIQGLMPQGHAYGIYGSTEVEPVAILTAGEGKENGLSPGVCVGTPHPDLAVRLLVPGPGPLAWPEARFAAAGDVGEILVCGPHVCVDARLDPTAFAEDKLRDPEGRIWHRMGDLGQWDAAGRLHLLGRLAHMVTTERGVLYPIPCELAAQAVDGVRRAALVGRAGESWLVVEPALEAELHDLHARLLAAVGGLAIDRIVFHPLIPVDARHNAKVDHERLLADLPDQPPALPPLVPAPGLTQGALAYLAERFPLGKNLPGIALMVASDGFATLALMETPLTGALFARMGLVATVYSLVFFHLRVFDEYKDWAVDRVAFPERVLSRGWVKLSDLRVAAGLALIAELVLAASAGPVVLGWTVVLIGYTVGMLYEFFVGTWLKKHLVLYGVSHMAIISLMSLAAYGALLDVLPGNDDRLWHPSLLLFAAMNFCMVYSLEVARKIRVPAQERPHVDTYSRQLGIPGALLAVVGMQALGLTLLAIAAADLHVHPAAFVLAGGSLLGVTAVFVRFGRHPEAKMAKKLEAMAAMTYLLLNVTLIATWGFAK